MSYQLRVLSEDYQSEKDRCCFDCKYLHAHNSWWCTNEEAIEFRGTSIPDIHKCTFWERPKVARWWDFFNPFIEVLE